MTPQIFPGLKPPISQLFFDLQAMIAENGGRLALAHKIEVEQMRPRTYRHKRVKKLFKFKHYSADELQMIMNGIKPSTRSKSAYNHKRWDLRRKGLL